MAQNMASNLEKLVKDKVDAELANISGSRDGRESRQQAKSVKDVFAALPDIANIITVAVSTAVSSAVREITDKLMKNTGEVRRSCLLTRFENDKLEQYMRRDNLRIFGMAEEAGEEEDVLEGKLIELTADMGVTLRPEEISVVHRVGKPRDSARPVIVRFTHRKKKNEIMNKKKELKKKGRNIFINEDLTPLRAALLKMTKEQENVKNAVTRDGTILAWVTNKDRPVRIDSPDDLHKIGITSPDWRQLRLDHLVRD